MLHTQSRRALCELLIGADAVVAGGSAALSRLRDDALVIVNEDSTPTSEFIKSRDWYAPITDLIDRLRGRVRPPASRPGAGATAVH